MDWKQQRDMLGLGLNRWRIPSVTKQGPGD